VQLRSQSGVFEVRVPYRFLAKTDGDSSLSNDDDTNGMPTAEEGGFTQR
jgi:hypothetical protein